MPEFILNENARKPHAFYSLDEFQRGYVEAMFFTNGDTGDENDDWSLNNLGTERLTIASVSKIKADCNTFLGRIMPDGCFVRQWLDRIADYDDAQAGRDFWYTRQGHGCGYWDREQIAADVGEALSKAAKQSGECYIELHRGWIHVR